MKTIGSIFGIKVVADENIGSDEIRIVSPTKETTDRLQAVLGKLFQPGKYEFREIKKD